MILKSARLSALLPAIFALAVLVAHASAQTTGTTAPKPTTTTTTTGTATPQGITGTDPTPIKWPPSAQAMLPVK